MGRYIDADDFRAEVRKISKSPLNEWDTWGVLSALERVPTADVVPVVHAHWFKNDFGVPLCSACHKGWDSQPEKDGSPLFEYCPCCGAIMDEEVGK